MGKGGCEEGGKPHRGRRGRVPWIGGENMDGGRSTLEMGVVRGAEGGGGLGDGGA